MDVAVIGGGIAGIAAAKNCLQYGQNVTVFEQKESLGGTWVYSEHSGKNKYGIESYSSMYRDLQ